MTFKERFTREGNVESHPRPDLTPGPVFPPGVSLPALGENRGGPSGGFWASDPLWGHARGPLGQVCLAGTGPPSVRPLDLTPVTIGVSRQVLTRGVFGPEGLQVLTTLWWGGVEKRMGVRKS